MRRCAVWWAAIALGGLVLVVGTWRLRFVVLRQVGRALVHESVLVPVDVLFLSEATGREGPLEALELYRRGVARRVVMGTWPSSRADDDIRALGVPVMSGGELAREVLLRGGVPRDAVMVLPALVEGTTSEARLVVEFVASYGVENLLFLTARDHTARARWHLRSALPGGFDVRVRSPARDPFDPGRWWESRDAARSVAMEILRWGCDAMLRESFPHRGPG